MPTPQVFIPIDSTAAESASGIGNAQVSTALMQRLRQNNRYLVEWRGPTLEFIWPLDTTISEGYQPFFPRLGFATWACFGPFRYYVPDTGNDEFSIRKVDVTIKGAVATYRVKAAAFSLQGNLGQPPRPADLDAIATTIGVGLAQTTFQGVDVRPGWNDIYLAIESETEWNQPGVYDLYFRSEFGGYPAVARLGGTLEGAIPPLLNGNVPFVALRLCVKNDDKDLEFSTGSTYTVAYSGISSDMTEVDFVFLAEITSFQQIPYTTPQTPVDIPRFAFYWSELGHLILTSLSITPYSEHPDKQNDPSLRWYQNVGSNVSDVYWQGSRLANLRHEQVGRAHAKQDGYPYSGCWKIVSWGSHNPGVIEIIREVGISMLEEQPTEGEDQVSIEVSIPASFIDRYFNRPDSAQRRNGEWMKVIVSLIDTVSNAVFDQRIFPIAQTPRLVQLGRVRNGPSLDYWLYMMDYQVYSLSAGRWNKLAPCGQPWSHDGTVALGDLSTTLTPLVFTLPIRDYYSIRQDAQGGKLFTVRLEIETSNPTEATIVAFGPMTARLRWGVQ